MADSLNTTFFWFIIILIVGVALIAAIAGLRVTWRQVTSLTIPADAGLFETMRYLPISLVILLDLLDFVLDIFAAPITWILLNRLGLRALRNTAAIEALIPFTQFIPTLTIVWILANVYKVDDSWLR